MKFLFTRFPFTRVVPSSLVLSVVFIHMFPGRRPVSSGSVSEEASEVGYEEEVDIESEGEGEDLLGDNMMDDYASNPELDQYDPEMLDDTEDIRELTTRGRLAAEREIREREGREARGGRRGLPMIDEDEDLL